MVSVHDIFLEATDIRKRGVAQFSTTVWSTDTPSQACMCVGTHTHTHTHTHTTPTHQNSEGPTGPLNADTRVHWVTHGHWDSLCLHGLTSNPTTPGQKSQKKPYSTFW